MLHCFFPSAFDIQLIDIRYSKIKNEPQNRRTPNRRISKYFASFFFPSAFDIRLIDIRYSKIKNEPQNVEVFRLVLFSFGVRYSIFKNEPHNFEVFCIVLFPSTFDIQMFDIRYSKLNHIISKYVALFFSFGVRYSNVQYSIFKNEPQHRIFKSELRLQTRIPSLSEILMGIYCVVFFVIGSVVVSTI